jgi:hypothetical protein
MDRTEMKNQPLSHDDASALMSGQLPQDRPDLMALAAAIDDFRDAFAEPAPAPSPELMGWLTGAPAQPLRTSESAAPTAVPVRGRTSARLRQRIRASARALAGVGLTAKFAFGGTAALAVVGAAGAVGVLPEKPQEVFDRIVGNGHPQAPVTPTQADEAAKTGALPDAPPDAGAEADFPSGSGEQRPPRQNTPEREEGSGEPSHDTSSPPPRGEADPAPDSDRPEDSGDEHQGSRDDELEDQPDDEHDDEPDEGADEPEDQPDDEHDDEPDEGADEPEDQPDDEHDDGSDAEPADKEETDGSSDDTADEDDSSNSSDDVDDFQVEVENGEVDVD